MPRDESITDKEARLIDTPGGMARVLWYRLWRNLRLAMRAEAAQMEHEILYGNPRAEMPRGILNVKALVERDHVA